MTKKRSLTAEDQRRFRAILQSATVAALMDFRRWQPGELAFQGGGCLHLAHGSARFSEDLDFMVRGGLSLQGLARDVQRRLQFLTGVSADLRRWLPSSWQMNDAVAATMIAVAVQKLVEGIAVMAARFPGGRIS